jgi:hypothetical protein
VKPDILRGVERGEGRGEGVDVRGRKVKDRVRRPIRAE